MTLYNVQLHESSKMAHAIERFFKKIRLAHHTKKKQIGASHKQNTNRH